MLVINSINFKDICIYELLIYSKFEKLHNGGLGTHDLPNTFEDLFPTNSYNLRSHIGGTSSKSKMGLASKNVATFVLIVMVIICITCTSVLAHSREVFIGPCIDNSDCVQNCKANGFHYGYCIPNPTNKCFCYNK